MDIWWNNYRLCCRHTCRQKSENDRHAGNGEFVQWNGGACAALISAAEFYHIYKLHEGSGDTAFSAIVPVGYYITIVAGAIIGTVSYTGSIIAWGKLNGRVKDFSFKGQHIVNMIVLALVLVSAVIAYRSEVGNMFIPFMLIGLFAFVYGVLFVLPIGGADMPVVISLLNSLPGLLPPAVVFYMIIKQC